jgi:hypothetical protein
MGSKLVRGRSRVSRSASARVRGRPRDARIDAEVVAAVLLLDLLTGPFYYRLLLRHAPLNRQMAHAVVDCALEAAAVR